MSSKAFSIGRERRSSLKTSPNAKFVPGPGTHEPRDTIAAKAAPKWVFGSGKRPALNQRTATKELGPGAYEIRSRMVENQQYSMGAINHKQRKYGSLAPGPGTYEPKHDGQEVSLRYSMGAVTVNKDSVANKSRQLPGPGNYEPKTSYDSQNKYHGHTKFGTGQRQGIYNDRLAKFVPSPFAYKQEAGAVQRSPPKFSFGSQKQRPNTSKVALSVPGPGNYDIPQIVGNEGQGKTLHSKLSPSFERPGANNVPGPGSYQDMYKTSKKAEPSWKMGTSQRDQDMKITRRTQNFPPPNNYDPLYSQTLNTSSKWGFGTGKRAGLSIGKHEAPSMQSYNIPSKAVEGQTWFMGLKLEKHGSLSTKNLAPGPGTYDGDYKAQVKAMPKYSMKGKYSPQKRLNVPGPGTYKSSLHDKKAAPQYGFGSSPQRQPTKKTLSPGPGGYNIPCSIAEMPAYAMPGRGDKYKYI